MNKLRAFYRAIVNFFYRPYCNICCIIDFIPTLWNNYDFQHEYVLMLLRKKFQRMEKYFKSSNICVENPNTAKEIRVAIDIIDRLLDDNYCSKEYEKHYEKWGEVELMHETIECVRCKRKNKVDKKCAYCDGTGKMYRSNFAGKNAQTEEEKKQESAELCKIYDKSEQMKNDDWRFLFNFLHDKMREWWD